MFDMLSSERRTARFMIWPARLAVSAETGTRTSARQVSRQFSQSGDAQAARRSAAARGSPC